MAVGSAAAVAGAMLVLSNACLPDLAALPVPSPPDVRAVVTPTCGDGVIDRLDSGGATDEECDPGDAGGEGCTSDCRIACDGGRVDGMGHCYFVAGQTADFRAAGGLCSGSGRAHVVTIGTRREADFVADAGLTDGGYWVGLSRSAFGYITFPLTEPGWPGQGDACPGCYALGPDDGGAFADVDAGRDCVAGGGERWANHACGGARSLAVLCEREPPGQRTYFCNGPNCIDGLPAAAKRYVLPADLVTAADAPAACEPYGQLVMLDSSEEREQLVRELVTRFDLPFTVWIGLSQRDGGATWDDGLTRPLPWGDREPVAPGRAYLAVVVDSFDTQLAHADGDETARRLVVCQRR